MGAPLLLTLFASLLALFTSTPVVSGQYAQATITSVTRVTSSSFTNSPQFRSNPECAYDLVSTSNPAMFALGGYNVTGGGAVIPYPVYAAAELWSSTDGFRTATYKAPSIVSGTGQLEVGRIAGGAGYLANNNLLYFGGLVGEYNNTIYFSESLYYSTDAGQSWTLGLTGNDTYTPPYTRYEFAYTVVPNTNTILIAGGNTFYNGTFNDVWMSNDGYGRLWTQQNAGGTANPNVAANEGSSMVALYDSPTTLVWVTPFFSYYKSTDMGVTWSTSITAPWSVGQLAYPTFARELFVLAVDRDNFIYFAGGDSGAVQADMWLSTDKATTWTQIAIVNNGGQIGGVYAAAIGSCLAVRTVNGAKELDLYGGAIYTYSNQRGYNVTNAYALQMSLAFSSTAYPTQGGFGQQAPQVTPRRWYWYYGIQGPTFSVCASGYLTTPNTPTLSTINSANPAYLVWWITGSRVYTSGTTVQSQVIAGLAPLGTDGASQYIYPNSLPHVDGGGLTYLLASTGLGEAYNFVNVYSSGGVLAEDGFAGTQTITQNFTLSANPIATKCSVYGSASLNSGLAGAPIAPTGQSNTPQYRSNPECAMDLTATTNPTMFAIGGINSTGNGASLPLPSYSTSDIWSSTDGFTTSTYAAGQVGYPRLGAAAGYLANGNLVTWGGLAREYINTTDGYEYIVYDTSVTYSTNKGLTWNTSFSDPSAFTSPVVARYETAYCAVPYTNTLVTAGGVTGIGVLNDVWISQDGRGANWTLQYRPPTTGPGSRNPNSIPPHRGGAMVALYDSSYVSAQFPSPNSTLVLMLPSATYFKSFDLGRTWSTPYTAPWRPSGVPAGTFSRYLVAVTADRDNYLYFGGGDAGSTNNDLWMSIDRAETWTQLALVNNIANVQYASAIGSCMGVRTVNGVKQLTIYGGNVWVRYAPPSVTRVYTPTQYYALNFALATSPTPQTSSVTNVPSPFATRTWYWSYAVTSSAGSICASGTAVTGASGSVSTLTGTNIAYRIWFIQGARVFTNSTFAGSQIIAGLAPLETDGATNYFYPSQAVPVDGGGVTFYLAGTGFLDSQNFINIYNAGSSFAEDAETVSVTVTQPLTVSVTPIPNSFCASRVIGQATVASGLAGAPIALTGQSNTPQYRSNPECAYDLQAVGRSNATFWALGGYNRTFQTSNVPYPSYAQPDIWSSTDGFTSSATFSRGQVGYPREAAMAAYLPNGNLVTWGGLASEALSADGTVINVIYDISVTYSQDGGSSWNTSFNDNNWNTVPSVARFEAAYCAIPFTNTIVHAGGQTAIGVASDVWLSSDGAGATWIQMNPGGAATTVQPFVGGVMVAMYDSQYVSFQYQTPNSTLVLVSNLPYYYKSYDMGASWTPAYNSPWDRTATSALYPTIERALPVLVADQDNYLYYGGGDTSTVAPDFWFSVDKAESFTRLQMVNNLNNAYYAASIGSCLGVRQVNGQKQLDLYGGNLYTRNAATNAYSTTTYYSVQMNLAFGTSATIPNTGRYPVAGAQPTTYYWSYGIQNTGSNPFSICAQGTMVVSSTATLSTYGTANPAYPVWWMEGVRIFTNSTYSFSQIITGLAPIGTDGSSNNIYTNAPFVDGGGITYLLASTGLGDSNNFINVYANGPVIQEDGWTGQNFQLTRNFTVSQSAPGPFASQCRLNAAATIVSATLGAADSATSTSNTPQFRSNPECAYNLSSTNPTMFVIGGFNATGSSFNIPYPSYASSQLWYSNDGFQTATYSAGSSYARIAGNAAYLLNGNLVYWGGLASEYLNSDGTIENIIFTTTVTYSSDRGTTWYSSYNDPTPFTTPSTSRYESAYCAVPYTNTLVTAGGRVGTPNGTANDVWISTDGTGAYWTQTNSGGSATNVPAHYGSVMVALYDNMYVSAQYPGANSTLVLALGNLPYLYTSRDYGATWQQGNAPWGFGLTSYPTYSRPLAVMTADHDNYLYYAGGDAGTSSPDLYLSVDKAQSWTRVALSNGVARYVYAASYGSCMAVRQVNGMKQLALYGGAIVTLDTTTGLYSPTPVYALQINTQFISSSAFNASVANYPIPYPRTQTYYFQYQYTSDAGFSICTSGSLTVSNTPTLATINSANKAYPVYWAQGARVYSGANGQVGSQIFTGLDYTGTDGSSNLLYPTLNPPIDQGGLSLGLATTGQGETQIFVNVYSPNGAGSGGGVQEDTANGNARYSNNFTLSLSKGTLSCQVYGTATIAQATPAAPASLSATNTPQVRSNPECAFNLQQSANQLMFAVGGYNVTGGGAAIPYPSFARGDIWTSTSGFSSASYSPGQANYGRIAGAAAYLANGNLVTMGGLAGEYGGYTVYDTSVTYSADGGNTWNTSFTDANWNTVPSASRYEPAYCAIPYTNTIVLAGGTTAIGVLNDVWISTDGRGANWQQMNPGGMYTRVPVHSGSQMQAFYDSSAVSSLFYSSNSTLLLILETGVYFKSTSLGAYWSTAYPAPWQTFFSSYATFSRSLAVLTIDTDNYAYYGGGDTGAPATDFWLSVDKAESWTRMGVVNSFSGNQLFVAAIGSCLGVQTVSGQKQLVLYGGNIFTGTSGSNTYTTQYFSMQLNVAFTAAAPAASSLQNGLPNSQPQIWYWQYSFSATNPSYSICASGQLVTPGTATFATAGTSNPAYLIWWLGGTRIFTNSTTTVSQTIAGLAPIGDDGASQLLYTNSPYLDGGGLTYLIANQILGDSNAFINLYSTGSGLAEDGEIGTVSAVPTLVLQKTPISSASSCKFYASAVINSGLTANAVPASGPSQRLDPECAFDTTNSNPRMYALGGSPDGGVTAGEDAFYSDDGFTSSSGYIPPHGEGGRYNGGAAYLANGNIVWWGGLISNTPSATYYVANFYSSNNGANWTLTDNVVGPWARQLFAYTAIPYSNTIVMIGGIPYSTSQPSNDVWISQDGIGLSWTQQSNNSVIQPFSGGQVVALFDSQLVSPAYPSPYSTLVLVVNQKVYTSYNHGSMWINQTNGAWSVTYAGTRNGLALAADRDNIVYLVGGDSGSSDIWMSADKGWTWSQVGVNVNAFASGSGSFAAAAGSCAAVRYVNGQKTLVVYGGGLYQYSNAAYTPLSQFSLQLPLTYGTTAPTLYSSPAPVGTSTVGYFKYTLAAPGIGAVCASGSVTIGSSPKLGVSPTAYQVYGITGVRVFTPATGTSVQQTITNLAPVGVDGGDQELYVSAPVVDGGGLTYYLNGVMQISGGPISDGRTYVNVYNAGGNITEDWGSAVSPVQTGAGFVWSTTVVQSCLTSSTATVTPPVLTSTGAGGGTNNGGNQGASSSSSGLSGGAIAGIVIGSIVGAMILIPLCLFACLKARSRGGKNGSTQLDESGSEPSQMQPSSVEMQSAHDSEHSVAPGEEHTTDDGEEV